jgi:hypothetical protein
VTYIYIAFVIIIFFSDVIPFCNQSVCK